MQINILIRKGARRAFIEAQIKFHIRHLKLERSSYTLTVMTRKGQQAETGGRGVTGHQDKNIVICLDSGLAIYHLMMTVAHEMVHVKQIARGQLRYEIVRGKEIIHWLGKRADKLPYLKQPWELEAFARTELMVRGLEELFKK